MHLNFCDEQGYPGTIQSDGSYDGGDTAAIIGNIAALTDDEDTLDKLPTIPLGIIDEKAELFSVKFVPIRHPDPLKWYSQIDRFSRDQLIPSICAAIRHGGVGTLRYIYAAHKKRWFLSAWNTRGNGAIDKPVKFPDICGPTIWALWLRYKKPWWARFIIGILDIETLIGALNWRFLQPDSNRVTRNNMLTVIFSRDYMPTIASRIAFAVTDWDKQISKWEMHCKAVGEYPTAELFREYLSNR